MSSLCSLPIALPSWLFAAVIANPADTLDSPPPSLVGRFGTCYLTMNEGDERDSAEILEAISGALNADPRVLPFDTPQAEEHWDEAIAFYPGVPPPDVEDLVSGADARQALRFAHPLQFTVRVQLKDQPRFRTWEDIRAETYYVRWNGVDLLVTWEQELDGPITPASGHVVKDIMREAAMRSNVETYVQGCRLSCDMGFGHTAFVVDRDPEVDAPEWDEVGLAGTVLATVPTSYPQAPEDLSTELFFDLSQPMGDFAAMKNAAQRLRQLHLAAATSLGDLLLGIDHARTQVSAMPFLPRLKERWLHRRWRSEASRDVDRLWLLAVDVDTLRALWSSAQFDFEGSADETGVRVLFEPDRVDDATQMRLIDLSLAEKALAHISSRLDQRALTGATLLVAAVTLLVVVLSRL